MLLSNADRIPSATSKPTSASLKHLLYAGAAFFGFFVPYFDRLVALFPTPP